MSVRVSITGNLELNILLMHIVKSSHILAIIQCSAEALSSFLNHLIFYTSLINSRQADPVI